MRKEINEETKMRLIKIHEEVARDFEQFPFIKTTEDLFIWRDNVKNDLYKENGTYDSALRNKKIENDIEGNKSIELLYDWSKCYRMVDRSKSRLYRAKQKNNILDDDFFTINPTNILHQYLISNGKGNTQDLFDILQITELNLGVKYPLEQRTINTPYEFEKVILSEEECAPWPAPLFVTLLKAYGINGDDLLAVGRQIESLSNILVSEINKFSTTENIAIKVKQ